MSSNLRGEFFLHKRDSKLHASEPVHAAVQRARERGERVEQKPASHIRAYLERFRVLFQPVDGNNQIREFTQARNLEMFDSLLLSRIGIQKENIPDSYWELQRRLAREQGHGDVELSPSTKNELSDILIKDQKDSLHRWTSYFASPDSNAIPLWAKYWAFSAVIKLGKYDVDTHRFQHRSIDTVAPFPELNREALAMASEVVERAIQDTIPEDWDTELRRLAKQASFSSLYGHFLHELSAAPEQNLQIIDGSWRIFPKNSDPSALVDSLRGYSTGWCTAGYHTAETQLRAGDFHVYYSKNTSGEAVVPRVAIRMEGDSIGEIRGIGPDQNLDPYISPIMEQKMKEFGTEGDKYQKKSHHMKMLTEIEHLHKEGKPLSVEQLRFLWELDEQVQGFGYEEDPRVRELQSERNFRSDLAVCYGTTAEHVSISMQSKGFDKDEHIFSEGIVVHYGDLSIRPYDRSQWPAHIPQIVLGNFETSLEDLSGLSLPKEVHGNLDIRSVQELKQEFLPDKYNGIINFQVKNLENLTFLSSATGIFTFDAVERISDVIFPPHVESLMLGSYLSRIIFSGWSQDTSLDLQRVQFPEIVEESFSIDGVKDLSNVRLPRKVGSIALTGLERFESVNWPLEIDKSISLPDLKSANGLRLPESFTGSVEFSSLESVEGLKLPKMLHDVTFGSLKTGEGLKLPYKMTGELKMNYLHSARGIVFPREVETISLHQLETLDGLSLDRPLSEEDRARKNNGEFVPEPSIRVEVGYRIRNDEIKQFFDRPENRTANHSIIQSD